MRPWYARFLLDQECDLFGPIVTVCEYHVVLHPTSCSLVGRDNPSTISHRPAIFSNQPDTRIKCHTFRLWIIIT